MDNPQEIISKINSSSKIEDVISVNDFKNQYQAIVKKIHPDVCSIVGASDAISKLNGWKDVYENGKVYKDDVGTFKTNGYWVEFESKMKNLAWSAENYEMLKKKSNDHFKKYLPSKGELLPNGNFKLTFDKRAIPLSGLSLPQEHVNWVLNRLLEYSTYLSELGFSHCGINPESIFIVPETHGIQVCSFYHLTLIGNKIGTISAKHSNWYPQQVFDKKIAVPEIDLELSKKVACYLLGDLSGSGVKLRKTHNEDFVNFIIAQHSEPYNTLVAYKAILEKNFKKQFHHLSI